MGECACCHYEGDHPVGDRWLCLNCNTSWLASGAKAAAGGQAVIEETKLTQFIDGACCSHANYAG